MFCLNVFCQSEISFGANQIQEYYKKIENKKIAVVCNQTSIIKTQNKFVHLIDTLLKLNINIKKIFSPEHGFYGIGDNGEKIENSYYNESPIEIISLHGSKKKPSNQDLDDIDIVIFDIQDVGVRFYTYLSTLHLVMEACAENNKKLIILDRPNPNNFYIDGPVLTENNFSFLGMHPVPIVYGMTIGEYGMMINGENWLKEGLRCDIDVIKILNYDRNKRYDLPIKPSPNLPNSKSVNLYPSLCLLEQTPISIGRGTDKQFQIYGHPSFTNYKFNFNPQPNIGSSKPKLLNQICFGVDLSDHEEINKIELKWLINSYKLYKGEKKFFGKYFNKIYGVDNLEKQLKNGYGENEIRKSWKKGIESFKLVRKKYLVY